MASRQPQPRGDDITAALERLRPICLALPDCSETPSFGNPSFKAKGKAFAVLDIYKGKSCLWLRVDPGRRGELLALPGWFASPYDPRERALCCDLAVLDWDFASGLIRDSYRLCLLKG